MDQIVADGGIFLMDEEGSEGRLLLTMLKLVMQNDNLPPLESVYRQVQFKTQPDRNVLLVTARFSVPAQLGVSHIMNGRGVVRVEITYDPKGEVIAYTMVGDVSKNGGGSFSNFTKGLNIPKEGLKQSLCQLFEAVLIEEASEV